MGWLDLVPGGRAAYAWVVAHLAAFLSQGEAFGRQLEEADRVWETIGPPPAGGRTAAQYAVLNEWVTVRNGILADLQEWNRLAPVVRWVASLTNTPEPATLPPSLGVFPVAALIGAVATIVTVQLLMKQWLDAHPTRVRALADLMADSVAAGLITPAEAARVLDAGGRPSGGETLVSVVKWGAIGVAGLLVLQTLLPPRSGRRRR